MNQSLVLHERLEKLTNADNCACYEMANVTQKHHRLGFDVRFNVLQPGDKQLSHGPRIKVFKKGNLSGGFFVLLNKDENKIMVSTENNNKTIDTVNNKQLKTIVRHVKKYRNAYLAMWHDTEMTLEELKILFDKIDKETGTP